MCAEGRGEREGVIRTCIHVCEKLGGGGGGQLAGGCGREKSIAESLSIRLVLTGGTCTCI